VELPLDATPKRGKPSTPARPAKKAPPVKVGLRLLLVDDHASTLQVLTRILVADGHHVVPAGTVAAALAAAAEDVFDLVISDLVCRTARGTPS
jgi:PleD family two-component response regulator